MKNALKTTLSLSDVNVAIKEYLAKRGFTTVGEVKFKCESEGYTGDFLESVEILVQYPIINPK
jgi:hypothetical protein